MAINLSEQQLWTLDELGIPVWQLRQNPQSETIAESSSPEQLLTTTAKTFTSNCQVLVCYPATQVPAEQQLLANILKAMAGLDLSYEQCDLTALTELSADKRLPSKILIFGELPADSSELQHRCTLLPSLSDLIAQPAGKAAVWIALCQTLTN